MRHAPDRGKKKEPNPYNQLTSGLRQSLLKIQEAVTVNDVRTTRRQAAGDN
jgi:hypothetical protein